MDDPRNNRQKVVDLCHDFRDNARTDGLAAFSDGESVSRVESDRTVQRYIKLNAFAWQTHLSIADQCRKTCNVRSVGSDNRAGGFYFGADAVFVFFEIITEEGRQAGCRSVVLVGVFPGISRDKNL